MQCDNIAVQVTVSCYIFRSPCLFSGGSILNECIFHLPVCISASCVIKEETHGLQGLSGLQLVFKDYHLKPKHCC